MGTLGEREQVLGVLLPELLPLAEVELCLIVELVAGLAVLGRAAQQFLVDGEAVPGEVVPALLGVAEHVQHVPAGASQRKGRTVHAQVQDPGHYSLPYYRLHSLLGGPVVAQTPKHRSHLHG